MRSSAAVDFPFITIIKRTLFPVTAAGYLILLAARVGEAFSNNYLILAILALLISANVFREVSFYRALNTFPIILAISNIIIRWIFVVLILGLLGYLTGMYVYYSETILLIWIVLTPFVLLVTQFFAWLGISYTIGMGPVRNAVIVGANQLGHELFNRITDDRFLNIRVEGFFDDREANRLPSTIESKKLGPINSLTEHVKNNSVHFIYICLPIMWQPRIVQLLDDLRDTTASIYMVPDIFMFDLIQSRIDRIAGIPILSICDTPFYGLRWLIKRIIDLVLTSIILLLIWPVILTIGIGVKLTSPGPVIFKQRRYGLDSEQILVYKFRTMRVCEDGATIEQAKRDDDRITPFGRFLRRTSLDELPQFFNVLIGNMSIVGPRPHAVAHNEMYRKLINGYMIRHKVKPGITGWAQINGFRGETASLDKMRTRVEYDLEYLRNWSLAMDFWIILKTIFLVFRGDHAAY
jgi:putative colanic acid biosynthesis UDP-glucose lipid carrier transferase